MEINTTVLYVAICGFIVGLLFGQRDEFIK